MVRTLLFVDAKNFTGDATVNPPWTGARRRFKIYNVLVVI